MLRLPLSSSPIRALFDVAHLAEMAAPQNRALLPTLRQAIESARQIFRTEPDVKRVHCFAVTADGHLRLFSFGPKGGRFMVWDFGAL